ncbi:hypothetical protein BDZ90DRAFT_258829 [Jaminaea rosea]|uniref:Uncharacterized protein n=1 Tax=Jaminaea rosea TaxID=1569628 RepID=A0A316UTX3_9BASI|nr:hypothetical protein BDZ90DRAFT_258829 [Jaminaea rosea]PWN28747.1 hypothetical protein BDZ90DRAFT_258829 [Jaminaea rosea]
MEAAPTLVAHPASDADMMAEDVSAFQANADTMEYDEDPHVGAAYEDEVIADVEIGDAHDETNSTDMGDDEVVQPEPVAAAAATTATEPQQDLQSSLPMATTMASAPMTVAEVPMAGDVAEGSTGVQSAQISASTPVAAEQGYEAVEADAPHDQTEYEQPAAHDHQGLAAVAEEAGEPAVHVASEDAGTSAIGSTASGAVQPLTKGSTSAVPQASINAEQAEPKSEARAEDDENNDGGEGSSEQASTSGNEQQPNDEADAASSSNPSKNEDSNANDAASHPTKQPAGDDPSKDPSRSSHRASTPPPAQTIRLTFNDQSFALFAASSESSTYLAYKEGAEEDEIESIPAPPLAVPKEIFHQPLSTLFPALRVKEALGEFLEDADGAIASRIAALVPHTSTRTGGTTLVLQFPQLGLALREDSVYVSEVSLSDLVAVHEGMAFEDSMHVVVSEDECFLKEYRLLQAQAEVAGLGGGDDEVNGLRQGVIPQDFFDEVKAVEEKWQSEHGRDAQPGNEEAHDATSDDKQEGVSAEVEQNQGQEQGATDAAEQTFVTAAGDDHEEEGDEQDGAAGDHDDADNAYADDAAAEGQDAEATKQDAKTGAETEAEAVAEAEAEAEEPSYEPVADEGVEGNEDEEDATGEQEVLVEYEEEEGEEGEEGAAGEEADEDQGQVDDAYEPEDGEQDYTAEGDDNGEEEEGEDYAEDADGEEELEAGYGEDGEDAEALNGEDNSAQGDEAGANGELEAAESAATKEVKPINTGAATLGKRSFDAEAEDQTEDEAHADSGTESKKAKASH